MNEEEREKESTRLTERLQLPVKANLALRDVYRWALEFLRNCMVIAGLWYLAQKSGDWWLFGIAALGSFSLIGYCYTYIDNVFYALNVSANGWRRHIAIAGSVLLLQVIQIGITIGLMLTINKIVNVQSAK